MELSKWVKTSPWGDYKDPKQNHKVDSSSEIIRQTRRLVNLGKHIGSKPLNNLKRYLNE